MGSVPTFSPTGYLTFATALIGGAPYITFSGVTAYTQYQSVPTGAALPAGSSPASVFIQNAGPDDVVVAIAAATATTTGTANAGSTALTVASGTGIVVGQVVVGAGIQLGTVVAAVSGTAVTLSLPTTAPLSTTAVSFCNPITLQTGIRVPATGEPIVLNYVSSGIIQALATAPMGMGQLNISVGV
jgi:hypothetical protein